jgi:hypothetical protein
VFILKNLVSNAVGGHLILVSREESGVRRVRTISKPENKTAAASAAAVCAKSKFDLKIL